MNTLKNIDPKEISYFEAAINYTILHFNNGKQELHSYTLKKFEDELSNTNFVRPHRSYLINKSYVDATKSHPNSYVLKCGKIIPISRRKR